MVSLRTPRTCRPLKPVIQGRLVDVDVGEEPLEAVPLVRSLLPPAVRKSFSVAWASWKLASRFCFVPLRYRLLAWPVLLLRPFRLADLRGWLPLPLMDMLALLVTLRPGLVMKPYVLWLPVAFRFGLP